MLSSHVKRSLLLWLHNKSRLWKQADLVFHWCLYHKQNITYSLMDISLRSLVRYRVDPSKIKFISMHGHVISSMYMTTQPLCMWNLSTGLNSAQLKYHWPKWQVHFLFLCFHYFILQFPEKMTIRCLAKCFPLQEKQLLRAYKRLKDCLIICNFNLNSLNDI